MQRSSDCAGSFKKRLLVVDIKCIEFELKSYRDLISFSNPIWI